MTLQTRTKSRTKPSELDGTDFHLSRNRGGEGGAPSARRYNNVQGSFASLRMTLQKQGQKQKQKRLPHSSQQRA
jgi:hypothetical protein